MAYEYLSYKELNGLAKARIKKLKEAKTEEEELLIAEGVKRVADELKKRDREAESIIMHRRYLGIYEVKFFNNESSIKCLYYKIIVVLTFFLLIFVALAII